MFLAVVGALVCLYITSVVIDIYLCVKNKHIHGGNYLKLRWTYHLRRYEIDIPPAHLSPYHNLSTVLSRDSLAFFPTLDDPIMIQIAEDFNDLFSSKSTRFKAMCLLAMIQQNYTYHHSNVGVVAGEDRHFPVDTLTTKRGDCVDTALVYTSIGTNIGLDIRLKYTSTHIYCIIIFGGGRYEASIETTEAYPIPHIFDAGTVENAIYPAFPPQEFRESIRNTQ